VPDRPPPASKEMFRQVPARNSCMPYAASAYQHCALMQGQGKVHEQSPMGWHWKNCNVFLACQAEALRPTLAGPCRHSCVSAFTSCGGAVSDTGKQALCIQKGQGQRDRDLPLPFLITRGSGTVLITGCAETGAHQSPRPRRAQPRLSRRSPARL